MPLTAIILLAKSPEFAIEEVTDLWVRLTRIERARLVGNSFEAIFSRDNVSAVQCLKDSFEEVIRQKRPAKFPYVEYPLFYDNHAAEGGLFKVTG